ncbi:SPOR domain-containing protein [Fodinibius halophilus]|uniref:SPOR domain-containing protein n=1 Tax=Fodinibius halophilus TaxID=1736908 RepID=A0A6M1SZ16_9BACT|nr:SPOR domain-containing protein [Fodinibius halophilus]NGP89128.1 SPOR domain-containing protein [Fodinibius halophilus]
MKRLVIFLVTSSIAIGLLNACGPSEEEKKRREQARQDSLEQVRQQRLAQQRQDSIEQARQDSIKAAEKRKRERNRIEFDSDGAFSVQVEAWRSKHKAQSQIQKWKDRGYENAYVVKYGTEETGDIWFRVRLGHLATKEMAQKLKDKLQRKHNEQSWISMAQDSSETTE